MAAQRGTPQQRSLERRSISAAIISGYKKTDLKLEVGFSTVTIAKLSKGESVTTDTILRICERFDVQPGDIMEYVPDED